MSFKFDPTKQVVLVLAALAVLATGFNIGDQVLLHLVITLGWALILYWFYSYFSSKHKHIWDTVITALIIFLVLHYGTNFSDLLYPIIAVFIAITQKFFIEFKKSPIINPAVAGLLLMAAIVELIPGMDSAFISWWGTSFEGSLSLAILFVWIIFGLNAWRRLPLLFTFLITHFLLLTFRGEGSDYIAFTFLDSTIYFFAAIMLIDPKTSPIKSRQQIYYGILAALVYNILAQYNAPHYELFAIAAANITYYGMRPKLKKVTA